jgi:hypothetical protein
MLFRGSRNNGRFTLDRHTFGRVGRAVALASFAVTLTLGAPAHAAPPIVNVVDSSGAIKQFSQPQIDNNGNIYFAGSTFGLPPQPVGKTGAYVISGGTLMPLLELSQNGASVGGLTIDRGSGDATFVLNQGTKQTIYHVAAGGVPAVVADDTGPYSNIASLAVGRDGKAFFNATSAGAFGIFSGPDPVADKLVSEPQFIGPVLQSVRNDGAVLFRIVKPGNKGLAIYKGTNPATDLVFDYGNSFHRFNNALNFAENATGKRVFNAFMLNPQDPSDVRRGIFTGPDPVEDRLIDTSGPVKDLLEVALNEAGTIVYRAALDDGRFGLFDGPDLVADKIIATGDSLFGSTVTGLAFATGINDANQIVFSYTLANGTNGIAVATVPEPASLGLLVLVVGAVLGKRRVRVQLRRPVRLHEEPQ